jgi:hypothetical protein
MLHFSDIVADDEASHSIKQAPGSTFAILLREQLSFRTRGSF